MAYKLVWEDSFDAKELKKENWNIKVTQSPPNNELQAYTDRKENVSIGQDENGNNCLILTAKREDYKGKHFTSGRVNTKTKFSFKYGKIEASIKLPKTSDGIWPAFWLMGSDYDRVSWPGCGEIDIFEFGHSRGITNGTQDRYFNGSIHWGQDSNRKQSRNQYVTNDYSLQDNKYHLFTMFWDEDKISMYVDLDINPDAKPYFEAYIPKSDDPSSPGYYFHKEFFIIFNIAVGGGYTGITDHKKVTALNNENGQKVKMFVRSVRVFRREDPEEQATKIIAQLFQRPNTFPSEATKVDIILDKSLHSTGRTEVWDSLFEYIDLRKLPVEYFSKIKQYRQNDVLFQKVLQMAIEKPYTGKKIIKALFIIPNTSPVNDFSFINTLNEMNNLYTIIPTITTYSVFMSQNQKRFLTNDIIIIGGNDSALNSFKDKEKETKPLDGEGLKQFVQIIQNGKPMLFLHDTISESHADIFKPIFGDYKQVSSFQFTDSIYFKNDGLKAEFDSPFKLPKEIKIRTSHETFRFDEQYKVAVFNNGNHYYIESGIAGQSEACHDVELSKDEEKLLFNTIVHLYNKSCQ